MTKRNGVRQWKHRGSLQCVKLKAKRLGVTVEEFKCRMPVGLLREWISWAMTGQE